MVSSKITKDKIYRQKMLSNYLMNLIKLKIRFINNIFIVGYIIAFFVYMYWLEFFIIGIFPLLVTLHLHTIRYYQKLYTRQKYFYDNGKYPEI